ncbi:MAG: hypothetical protein R3C61_18055 [Bacteroidia bacterium]
MYLPEREGLLLYLDSTPFELTAPVLTPTEIVVTFCWEQFDLGPAGSPVNPTGTTLFRSFNPVTDSTRVFPRLDALVNNQSSLGEVLPTTSQVLNFRQPCATTMPEAV